MWMHQHKLGRKHHHHNKLIKNSVLCPAHHALSDSMQNHTTSQHLPGEHAEKGSSMGIRWLGGRSLHTTRSTAQIFVGVVFNVSSYLYVLVADLIAYRLNLFMSAAARRPVTPRLWSGFLVWLL